MALKNYYELLALAPSAPQDEIKRAFRQQIARYHPDKVQHLGQEFQAMAAERAADLTEAYRILSDEGRRAEYDRAFSAAAPAAAAPPPAPVAEPVAEQAPAATEAAAPPPAAEAPPQGERFRQERTTRDEFVRKATLTRFRQALEAVGGGYEVSQARGFDIACVPKSKLFARSKGPRLLLRFVSRVDADAVGDAWTEAGKSTPGGDDVCVFLMGAAMAPPGELARAIAEQRKKSRSANVTLIPIDARDWDAHIPTGAPPIAKNLLARLKTGT